MLGRDGGERAARHRRGRDAGMVTVETAVALPAIVLMLALCLSAIQVGVNQIRCVDAARVAARAMARGDSAIEVSEMALRNAPDRAQVHTDTRDGHVHVKVTAPGAGWGLLSSVHVSAVAVAAQETSP